jgi:hypothetical protein
MSSWPGLSRPSAPSLRLCENKDVDGRDKPGHHERRFHQIEMRVLIDQLFATHRVFAANLNHH